MHRKESFKQEIGKMLQAGVLKPVHQATPWINNFDAMAKTVAFAASIAACVTTFFIVSLPAILFIFFFLVSDLICLFFSLLLLTPCNAMCLM